MKDIASGCFLIILSIILVAAHVLDDCGHIPEPIDYYNGIVDTFGYKR